MSRMNVSLHIALATSLVVGSLAVSADARMYRGYEMPTYEVDRSEGDFEVRDYGSHLVAEVTVRGDRNGAINRGFRALADFIFGGNVEGTKVEMTVPVAQAENANLGDKWTVQFMMPAQYSRESLPTPDNKAIRFVETETSRQAVIQFSGRWTERSLETKNHELREWADRQGLTLVSGPRYYFYDSPFTLPFNRRNEIAYVVE